MIEYIKSWFAPKPTKHFIGVKKGCLDPDNLKLFQAGESFQYNGSAQDFVILPKESK